jgi:hypothetical protein
MINILLFFYLVFGVFLAVRKLFFVQKMFFILEVALVCIGSLFLAFSVISLQGIALGFRSQLGAVHSFVLVAPIVIATLVGLTMLVFSFYFADAVQEAVISKWRWLKFVRFGIVSLFGAAFIALGIYMSWLNQKTILVTSFGRANPSSQLFVQLDLVSIGIAVIIALQLVCALALLSHAIAAFVAVRNVHGLNNTFRLKTLGRVIGVGVVLVLAASLELAFQLMSIPSLDLVAPDWAADVFGFSVPLVLFTGALIFFIANALFSPLAAGQKLFATKELQPLLERDSSHVPEQYAI